MPRWATLRSPDRFTIGPAIAAIAYRLGFPLMPWQQLVADIGGEIDPDTGLPAYREVIVTIPRQSGKTTLVLCWMIQRALGWGSPQLILYSAQTGNDARKKLIDDQVPILQPRRHKLGIRRILRGVGNEAVEFMNGSRIVLLASTADSGHGKTIDLGIKDELFADTDDRRDQVLVPAMATRAAAQVLTTSTMGTAESAPLNRAVDRGRAAVEAGLRSGIAYFEWSADPADDPDDPATWWRCMPALGTTEEIGQGLRTVSEGVVAHARTTLADGEFRRAFLNQQTKAEERVIPASVWATVCGEYAPAGELVFALDVNPERNAGAIVAAASGVLPTLELVDQRSGTGWLVNRAVDLTERHGATRWVVDAKGPAASLISDLERAGLTVQTVAAGEMVEACGRFYDALVERKVRIRSHPKLDAAAAAAAKRSVGDAWAWTRRNTAANISPLVAATLAFWAVSTAGDDESVYEGERGLLVL